MISSQKLSSRTISLYAEITTANRLEESYSGVMEVPESLELLYEAYNAMNSRDVEAALALMTDDVVWPTNTPEGHVDGRDAVRKYLRSEWRIHPPKVEPVGLEDRPDGHIVMHVHEMVVDTHGNFQANHTVKHNFTLKDGLIAGLAIGG